MKRKDFIQAISFLPLTGVTMKLEGLKKMTDSLESTGKMPVLFLGHGSPMNAIEENEFVQGFRKTARSFEKPKAVLCISAHWETRGTFVTAMEQPPTIHDFGGFPKELFEVQYPAPGNPELARETKNLVKKTEVELDLNWGLDHGAWSVVKHMYPDADVPVIQMSLDYSKPPVWHYELAKELANLREKGVLIIGSGNMVHNLRRVAWDKLNAEEYGFDWAIEASAKMKEFIMDRNHKPLIDYSSQGKAFQLAIPTPEHYLPLLYSLALSGNQEETQLFNDKAVAGSLTMTSVKIG
ncbi:4,5-DOPA dioxygenase extradiol [Mariniphaga sp.]|uniref:4,5-DOPA-extradiol-dioxygenase n=1 Tax=Mariniphaga sp. TaxID=1954475 RepID=UPI003564AB1E